MAKMGGEEDYPFYFGAGPELLRVAAGLRRSMTPAEKVLWERLRRKQLKGYRFRRQHPLYRFVVDFFCYEALLIIEVDGSVHQNPYQKDRDIERTKMLEQFNLTELRFTNDQIINDIDSVLAQIERYLQENSV